MQSLIWRAIRARFFPVSLLSVFVGAAAVQRPWFVHSWLTLLLIVFGAFLVHAGCNLWNDFADDLNGADPANGASSPFNGGSRVIQRGELGRDTIKIAAILCFAAATVVAFFLVPTGGWGVPGLTFAGILLGFCYSSRPVWFCARGLGECIVAVCFGPLLGEGAFLALTGRLSPAVFWASLPLGLLVASILLLNSIPDVSTDAQVGKRTLAVRLGRQRTIALYRAFVCAAFIVLFVARGAGFLPRAVIWALLAVPLAVWILRRVGDLLPSSFVRVAAATVLLHASLGVLIVFGFLFNM